MTDEEKDYEKDYLWIYGAKQRRGTPPPEEPDRRRKIDWERVAKHLDNEGFNLRQRADTARSITTHQEMLTRASIFITLAEALRFGLRE